MTTPNLLGASNWKVDNSCTNHNVVRSCYGQRQKLLCNSEYRLQALTLTCKTYIQVHSLFPVVSEFSTSKMCFIGECT